MSTNLGEYFLREEGIAVHTAYFKNLLQYLPQEEQQQLQKANGATDAQIESLLEIFPQSPQSFIELLQDVNGTYHCKHGQENISVLVLGSDLGDYPYYLKAVEQILADAQNQRETIFERYQDFLEYVDIDKRINMHVPLNERLCFADCMNNGGTSCLYLDFSPAEGGKMGQVVRYVHDPDSFEVIASSFDEYLQQLVEGEYEFTALYEEEF
ncbi:SMI1 / KNR4 family (SUKH-1) [Lysinibacillus fusiformis]|uniref:SMI1 / KNR4 family (SUKH-1) n=1 Tax=Lysinibacillus fusiformis TaxID=28031 RepID=A0A1H9ASR4_9BACI|nr:SMI1/KNR4 family protein [Lysinibacillus fusiformis]SCX42374.1 SMI1 / KNR4 family (SUKH-1) [Lysinibacillus fusiformis]SCX82597.1 SMI1 / KNR4 family (SUKH-1) [Lysinibacillus fusiformis]SDB12104.1 SMI1 / KNR4 family (SUKH-1) [Lysinibacillus fusiformis]SEM77435.1 SMI1 / KNR4 family (SUKH-1) [Lysinibacillus fusiformis]SEP79796.1 SMI1 / KNR4 family (SUKH-1) [Lysinibacillus fusiformis]